MPETKKILVLEDDPAIRFALGRVSLGAGVRMIFAETTDWATIETERTIVLGSDFLIHGTGDKLPIEVLRERYSSPVILMTSTGNRRLENYAREAGAASVLYKPFGAGELRRHIGKLIGEVELKPQIPSASEPTDSTSQQQVFRPVEYGGQIAGDQVFDNLFVELEKRQPLEEGLDAFDVVERHLVKRALLTCDGNQSRAARFLGITRNTLRKRIKKYGFTALLAGDDVGDSDDE
jgi:DNA-binding NtrC family response regulator